MNGREALSKALVLFIEGRPIVQAVSRSHDSDADDWVIVEKVDGQYVTTHEIPEPEVE